MYFAKKNLFLIIILLSFLGCTSKKSPPKNQFRALASTFLDMNEEEFHLNECFTNSKVSCYELYPYDQVEKRWGESEDDFNDRKFKIRNLFNSCSIDHSMSCSKLAGRDDLVSDLEHAKSNLSNVKLLSGQDWFFLSPYKIKKFLEFIDSIKKIKNKISKRARKVLKKTKSLSISAMHGTGVGVTGSIFGGIGTSFTGEALVLDGDLTLFCAPGLMMVTDVGVQANLSAVRALACKDKEAYKGKFLSIQAGLSAEALMLPVGVEAAYSFGLNTTVLLDDLLYYKRNNKLNPSSLAAEFITLETVLASELAGAYFTSMQKASLWFAMILGKSMSSEKSDQSNIAKYEIKKHTQNLTNITQKPKGSLSYLIKGMIGSQFFQNVLTKYKLRNLKRFFMALNKSLTGCDSISGGVSVGLTLSPVNIGVMLNHYEEIFSADLERILTLKNLSAFLLLNPLLLDSHMLTTIIDIAHLVENFPSVVKNQCYSKGYQKFKNSFYLLDELSK